MYIHFKGPYSMKTLCKRPGQITDHPDQVTCRKCKEIITRSREADKDLGNIKIQDDMVGTAKVHKNEAKMGMIKAFIKEALLESSFNTPQGNLRQVKTGPRQYKIGKVEDENRELSSFEAEQEFPGSTAVWAEIVPDLFPDFPFNDPVSIKRNSLWFKIGNELRVAFKDAPQFELAVWNPNKGSDGDWVELDYSN